MPRFALKSWNCFGAAQSLGAFLRWKGTPDGHRFALGEVKAAVESVDVVCLQEVFLSDAELFFEALDHGHKTRDHNRSTLWPLTFGGSGLALASRLPIESSAVRGFGRPHVGAERFARKGMLHARLSLEPLRAGAGQLDVITTHMQSGYDEGARRVRARQLRELRALADEIGAPERPLVICGDFNIDGLGAARAEREYATLRELFSELEDLGAAEDRVTFDPRAEGNDLARRHEAASPHQRIDYVLFRAPPHGPRPTTIELALAAPFTCPQRGRTFASDHYALRVEFELPDAPTT